MEMVCLTVKKNHPYGEGKATELLTTILRGFLWQGTM